MTKIRTLILILFYTSKLFGQVDSTKSEIKAQANEAIETSIILEEKELRKINETITKRIKEISDTTFAIKYKVSFSNNSYYTTNNFEYILREENSDLRRITNLEITAKKNNGKKNSDIGSKLNLDDDDTETISVDLDLANGKLTYSISGGNRDWVLNTQTDLIERFKLLENKQTFVEKYFPYFGTFFCFLTLVMIVVFFAISKRKKYIKIEKSKTNTLTDISLLDYMFKIEDPHFTLRNSITYFYVVISGTGLVYILFKYLSKFIYPKGILLIGEQIIKYEKILSTRDFIFNGVIIGLVVSIIAGIIANSLTNGNKTE